MTTTDFTLGPKELPEAFEPSEFDVICSWARQNFSTAGNRRLREIIANNVSTYQLAETKVEKGKIIQVIIKKVMASSPSRSGFIRQDKETGRWTFIGFEKAKDKVGHALRQASKQKDRKRKELHNHEVLHPRGNPSLVSTASRSQHSNHAADHTVPRPHPSHYSWYHPCLPMPVYHNAQMDDSQSFKRFKPLSSPFTVTSAATPVHDNGGARTSHSMVNAVFSEEVVGPPGSSEKRSAAQSPDPRKGSYQVHTQRPPATSMVSPRGSPTSVADVYVGNHPCMDVKREERYSYSRPYHHPSSHYLSQHGYSYSPPPNSHHPTHVAPHGIPPPHQTQQYDMPHHHPSYYPPIPHTHRA